MLACPPTGRITYAQLRDLINQMNEDQLYSDVTVEDANEDECYAAELRIAGETFHTGNGTLDEGHPVIYLNRNNEL